MALMHIDNIQVQERIRPLNEKKVKELTESIRELGLLNPITVQDDGTLVAGYHRLEACRRLAQESEENAIIHVSYFDHLDKIVQAELAENLFRNDLSVLERAEHLVMYLDQCKIKASAQEQAEVWGISRKTFFNYRKIVRDISPLLRQCIKERHPDIKNATRQLLTLADLSPEEQVQWLEQHEQTEPKAAPKKQFQKQKTLTTSLPQETHQQLQTQAQKYGLSKTKFTQQLLNAALKALDAGHLHLDQAHE